MTLTPFKINTYAKPGGGGFRRRVRTGHIPDRTDREASLTLQELWQLRVKEATYAQRKTQERNAPGLSLARLFVKLALLQLQISLLQLQIKEETQRKGEQR